MKVQDLFEMFDYDEKPRQSRSEFDWNHEAHKRLSEPEESRFNLVDKVGNLVRANLTKNAVIALRERPDLIKKHGRLFVKKI